MTVQSYPSVQPGPVTWRMADSSVLIIAIVALIIGVVLRQTTLFATSPVDLGAVAFDIPAGAIARTQGPGYLATTENGFSIRVEEVAAPPIGTDDLIALTAARSLTLAEGRPMFQSLETAEVDVGGTAAAELEYAFVSSNSDSMFASGLEITHGYELIVPQGETLYAISLEGPEEQSEALAATWERVKSSVRIEGDAE